MEFNFDIVNVLVLIATCTNLTYGLIIYSRNRRSATNLAFFFLTIGVGFWGASMLVFRGFVNDIDLGLSSRLLYASAAVIPFASLYFAIIFPKDIASLSLIERWVIPTPFFIAVVISLIPGFLINGAHVVFGNENFIDFNIKFHIFYVFYIAGYFSWVFMILIQKYRHAERELRTQVLYILIGTLTTTSIALVTNLLLPFFHVFALNWVGQVGVAAMITSITYSISRHHLFDIKIIATELFVFFLWVFILARALIADSLMERVSNLILFVITVGVGLLLVRSVIKEVEAREQIEKLAKDLEAANERLKELDQLKSEFVSIASHQLRSPLTAIKGYASLILEGSFGKAPPAIGEAVGKILDSSSRLVLIIEDFLNLSRIEQGRMKYDFAPTDVEAMVKSVVGELAPTIKTAGLSISFTTDNQPPYKSNLDVGKIKQVIGNIIDNSIKYTPRGSIQVSLKKETQNAKRVTYNVGVEGVQNTEGQNNKILITVADTGIGISKETLPTLFEKFSRAKDASKTNTTGTGLGLYVAKQMVEAHGGRIWAESDGVGKGSRFKVELGGV